MKFKFLSLIFLFLLSVSFVSAQSLYFCEDVDDDGYAINSSNTFTITEDGGSLNVLCRVGYEVDTYSVEYRIYKVDSDGDETYDNTIYQDVEPEWVWFYKEIIFYSDGKYNVYVYTDDDEYLTSGTVRIKVR
jgi:hypothetical protein